MLGPGMMYLGAPLSVLGALSSWRYAETRGTTVAALVVGLLSCIAAGAVFAGLIDLGGGPSCSGG